MERQQPPPNWSPVGVESSQAPPAPERATVGKFLLYCLEFHPFVFWSGVWTTILIVAGVAVTGLMSPYFLDAEAVAPTSASIEIEPEAAPSTSASTEIEPEAAPPASVTASTPSQTSERDQTAARSERMPRRDRDLGNGSSSIPLWSLAALVFSCAAGSLVISQRLKRSPAPRPKPNQAALSPNRSPKRLSRPAKLRAVEQFYPQAAPVYPHPTATFFPNPDPVMTVVPTVVPEEESHPLDWGEEPSLADMMDIRRRVFSSRL